MMWLRTILLCVVILKVRSEDEMVDMTKDIIDVFLNEHNAARKEVQVPSLEWSNELSQSARAWALQCLDQHSDTENGENLYSSSAKSDVNTKAAGDAVKVWVSEIKDVDPDWSCTTREEKTCGHYSQIVWKDTTAVGCSIVHCDDADLRDYVVCQYSPPGNYDVEAPY